MPGVSEAGAARPQGLPRSQAGGGVSVSVCWRPVPPRNARGLDGFLGSTGLEVLRRTFGPDSGPIKLGAGDVPRLRAMAEVDEGCDRKNSAYSELADLVEQHDAIEVWGEW
jgi:hypothetical protein